MELVSQLDMQQNVLIARVMEDSLYSLSRATYAIEQRSVSAVLLVPHGVTRAALQMCLIYTQVSQYTNHWLLQHVTLHSTRLASILNFYRTQCSCLTWSHYVRLNSKSLLYQNTSHKEISDYLWTHCKEKFIYIWLKKCLIFKKS